MPFFCIFDTISSLPGVHFDNSSRLVINDRVIPGSNATTLISDLLRTRKTPDPIGWSDLSKQFSINNVSMDSIINPHRKQVLRERSRSKVRRSLKGEKTYSHISSRWEKFNFT